MDNRLLIPGRQGEQKTDSGLILPGQESNVMPAPGMPLTSDGQIPPEAMAAIQGAMPNGGMGMGGLLGGLLGGMGSSSSNSDLTKRYEDNPNAVETISVEDILEEFMEDVMFVHDCDASGRLRKSPFNAKVVQMYPQYEIDYNLMVEQADVKERIIGDVILTACDNKVYIAGDFGSYTEDPDKEPEPKKEALKKGLKDRRDLIMGDRANKYPRRIVLDKDFGAVTPDTREAMIKSIRAIFDYTCVKVLFNS
ncbi:MAG: hypothetical protein J6Y02_10070 [Pseudobutyrivibrio sp.]|nr:hypothetical protein [Pseudobutyrivibrio sp.]